MIGKIFGEPQRAQRAQRNQGLREGSGRRAEGNLHEWGECRFADLNGWESGREDIENMKTAPRTWKGRWEGWLQEREENRFADWNALGGRIERDNLDNSEQLFKGRRGASPTTLFPHEIDFHTEITSGGIRLRGPATWDEHVGRSFHRINPLAPHVRHP